MSSQSASKKTKLEFKAKLILVCFGLFVGLLATGGAYTWLRYTKRNQEFDTLDDLRSSIANAGETEESSGGTSFRSIITPHPDDHIIYELRPNIDVKFQNVRVTTNSCGMRGIERQITKPAHTYRIALLGDSFSFGWGVEQDKIFAQRLEDNLNKVARSGTKVEVLNFGVPGYSTFQEVYRFLDSGKDFLPDAILVYYVENDFGLPFFVRDVSRNGAMLPAISFAKMTWQRDPKAEAQKMQLQGWDPNSSLKILANYARENGIRLVFTINPKKDWKNELARLGAVRKSDIIEFANLRPDLMREIERQKIDERDLTLPTDPHPSAIRHALLGDALTPFFIEDIQ